MYIELYLRLSRHLKKSFNLKMYPNTIYKKKDHFVNKVLLCYIRSTYITV